jgi:hypothetical protein
MWSLLKLNPQKQNNYLRLLGTELPEVESYFPVYTRMSRPHGVRRAREVERPVYPGYVFIRVGDGICMHGPVSLPISAKWVRFGGKVEVVSNRVIEGLRQLEGNNELIREIRYQNPYTPGTFCTVHLPVGDIMGIIVRLMGRNRAIVDSNLCRITVSLHQLQVT